MSARKGSSSVASRLVVKVISVPSGDHDGPISSLGWLVRLVSPLPSRFTAQISHGSQQPLTWLCFMNTTFVLSGDQSGARSSPSKLSPLRMVSFWPSGSIVTISHPLSLTPANAILVPSGDQAGSISVASVLVRLMASSVVGSVSITKMSGCSEMTWPAISLTKTIWVPDGAQEGWYSWMLSASGISGVLVRLVWFVPSASITQMSVQGCPKQFSLGSVAGLTKVILPSGEVVWAEVVFVGSRPLAKNNSAIKTPRKMIACLAPILQTSSCMTSLLSGRHDAAAFAPSDCTCAYKRTVWIR